MKRFLSITLAIVFTMLSVFSLTALADNPDIKTSVNGRIYDAEAGHGAVLIEGEPYVPLTIALEAAGEDFEWNGEADITIFEGVQMISSDTASQVFGLSVKYNSTSSIISVIKPKVKEQEPVTDEQTPENDKAPKQEHVFITVVKAMNEGFLVTLKLFAITLIGALPLGLVISLCSMSKFLPLKLVTRLLVWIIRGTPLMLQLLIIFFIPGMVLEGGSPWPRGEEGRFMAASVAFIINYAFYFSEIFRGGIESIPGGQVEAGQVLGMTKTQIFFNVTLLQMVKRIVPPMSNEIITLVKDTSIARIISLQEVIWAGYAFLKSSHGYSGLLWPLFFTGVYYLLFNGILTILFSKIEKKLGYFN